MYKCFINSVFSSLCPKRRCLCPIGYKNFSGFSVRCNDFKDKGNGFKRKKNVSNRWKTVTKRRNINAKDAGENKSGALSAGL